MSVPVIQSSEEANNRGQEEGRQDHGEVTVFSHPWEHPLVRDLILWDRLEEEEAVGLVVVWADSLEADLQDVVDRVEDHSPVNRIMTNFCRPVLAGAAILTDRKSVV